MRREEGGRVLSGVIATLFAGFIAWYVSSKSLDLQKKEFQYIKIYEPLIGDLIGMKDLNLGNFRGVDYKMKNGALYQHFTKCENDFYRKIHNQNVDVYLVNIRDYFSELISLESEIGEIAKGIMVKVIVGNSPILGNGFDLNNIAFLESKSLYNLVLYKYDPTEKLMLPMMDIDVKKDITSDISKTWLLIGNQFLMLKNVLGNPPEENSVYSEIIEEVLRNEYEELETKFSDFVEKKHQLSTALKVLINQLEEDYIMTIK